MLEHDEEMLERNVIRVELPAKLETALNHLIEIRRKFWRFGIMQPHIFYLFHNQLADIY